MSAQFLAMSQTDRKLAFDNAALSLQLNAVILEKDFWVTWLLGLLFSLPQVAPFLLFKGGTSLSKVFGVIDRFSEDIDLCLVPEFVGADAAGFDALASRVKRDAAVLEMQLPCWLRPTRGCLWAGRVMWWRWNCSARFGRRRRFCMPSTTAQRVHPRLTAMPGTTLIWPGCWRTPALRSFWPMLRSATVWWTGRAVCLRGVGRVMTWRAKALSGWCRRQTVAQTWHATTPPCAPCSCPNHRRLIN